jgi:integrase
MGTRLNLWGFIDASSNWCDKPGSHITASMMRDTHSPPKTVQTMLGHASITTTLDIYSHVSLELETRAAAKLSDALRLAQQ